ncbi:putative integral membrane protein [Babesia bovis T2Bo]|uniref:Uncharacterized protein n=1 Tax=Babesia bovis TaxID=5865 RepID=A7AQK8_BABBO|nr:putative integral membrane protein [Babesia bovis T2Bo]EDO06827.1 putative integral membrane protein [Babesia bovis T2Bo]|eukprot:XP_001610395.1 hypothetical protein [Babesia bovis T2Bo]
MIYIVSTMINIHWRHFFVATGICIILSGCKSYGMILDLDMDKFPDNLEIFRGTLENGGKYFLYHSSDPIISKVIYRGSVLNTVRSKITNFPDVYVQKFEKEKQVIVGIHYFYSMLWKHKSRTCYFLFNDTTSIVVHRSMLSQFSGHLFLPLDLKNEKQHPFVVKSHVGSKIRGDIWAIIASTGRRTTTSYISRLRSSHDCIFFSPITNIDSYPPSPNYPPTSIYAHCTKVHVSDVDGNFYLHIKRDRNTVIYLFQLPKTKNYTFKPGNILRTNYRFGVAKPSFPTSRQRIIVIDIATFEVKIPDLVILANVRRGDWLYHQYTILPLWYPDFPTVTVINSVDNISIYKTNEQTYVECVEIFINVDHGWQYVVLTIAEWDGMQLGYIKKVYMRMVKDGNDIYYDLEKVGTSRYVDLLYNIKTLIPYQVEGDSSSQIKQLIKEKIQDKNLN